VCHWVDGRWWGVVVENGFDAMPASVVAVAVLVAEGVVLLTVGSVALWLHGEAVGVHDLDVVVDPCRANLCLLREALGSLGARRVDVPSVRVLETVDLVGVVTGYGRVDLMLERGRADWGRLAEAATGIDVCGVSVPVVATSDAWELRWRFKGRSLCD
jgi:hypothetical protein